MKKAAGPQANIPEHRTSHDGGVRRGQVGYTDTSVGWEPTYTPNLKRSHVARSVYELDVLDDDAMARGIKRFIDAGEEARFVEHVPLKLVIIDEATVLFGMQDPMAGSEDLTIMVVEHPALAQTLKLAFNRVWDRGLEFDAAMDLRRGVLGRSA